MIPFDSTKPWFLRTFRDSLSHPQLKKINMRDLINVRKNINVYLSNLLCKLYFEYVVYFINHCKIINVLQIFTFLLIRLLIQLEAAILAI